MSNDVTQANDRKPCPVLHSIAFCTVLYRQQSFLNEGTKLEMTLAKTNSRDKHEELKDTHLAANSYTQQKAKLISADSHQYQ